MAVLERADLEASPLADLHAIADQLGLEAFRRLRKADLIDAILGDAPAAREAGDRDEVGNGDRASGPVRAPRRSERYPSLVRVEEINGEPAGRMSEAARYDDLPVAYPSERITFGAGDATLEAIEWLAPLGRGSRAV